MGLSYDELQDRLDKLVGGGFDLGRVKYENDRARELGEEQRGRARDQG